MSGQAPCAVLAPAGWDGTDNGVEAMLTCDVPDILELVGQRREASDAKVPFFSDEELKSGMGDPAEDDVCEVGGVG